MSIPSNYCIRCLQPTEGSSQCPHCGYAQQQNPEPFLPVNTVIQGKYSVGCLLFANGDGATYAGWDNSINSPIQIREFFPVNISARNTQDNSLRIINGCETAFYEYYKDFITLARMLAKLRDIPMLIPIYDIFETNNTVYYIGELVQGCTLGQALERHSQPLEWKQVRTLFVPVINGLAALHAAGINHYSVNPENLILDSEGKLRLTNFSITAANSSGTYLNPQIFEGYSALEQYRSDGKLGHYTDVYGLAATMYAALTGNVLPDVSQRMSNETVSFSIDVSSQLPPNVLSALNKALKVHPEMRTHSVDVFKQELTTSNAVSGVVREFEKEKEQAQVDRAAARRRMIEDEEEIIEKPSIFKTNTGLYIVGGVLALLLIITIVILIMTLSGKNNSNEVVSSEPASLLELSEISSEPELSELPSVPELTFAVPDAILGLEYSALTQSTQWSYMSFRLDGYVYSDIFEAGKIAEVTPAPGTLIAEGETISVKISLGSQMRELPKVVGKKAYQAAATLSQLGFVVIVEEDSTQGTSGEVIAVDLTAGREYEVGTHVTITVSTYEKPVEPSSQPPSKPPIEPSSETPPEPSSETPPEPEV